jgi:hypothetical protein
MPGSLAALVQTNASLFVVGCGAPTSMGEFPMSYYETQQHMSNPAFNPQLWTQFNPHFSPGAGYGLGQAAYGQGLGYWGAQPLGWGQQQRQLSQHDVNEVVRQLLPALPQIIAQAQNPFTAGIGHAAYGQMPRQLSQQDVNEVVRQLLPFVPQIVGTLQGQPNLQYAGMQGGPFGQFGSPQFQPAFGASTFGGQPQRQLSQQDVADITRQLVGLIPQVIGNLQTANQQRMI